MSIFESVEAYDELFSLENPLNDPLGGYAAARSATFHRITSVYKKYAGKVIQIYPDHKYLGGKKIKLNKFKIDFDRPIWEDGETFEVGKVEDGRTITGKVRIDPYAISIGCYCDVKKKTLITKKEKIENGRVFTFDDLERTNAAGEGFCKIIK